MIDCRSRISKCGDAMLRRYSFGSSRGSADARPAKWPTVKAWGVSGSTRGNGLRKAKVAVARKLSRVSFLHRMWIDGTEFNWSKKEIAAHSEAIGRSSCQTAGKDVPAGTRAMVSSDRFLRASERTTAIATLNRQRHLTPSWRRVHPYRGRREQWTRQGRSLESLDTQTRN